MIRPLVRGVLPVFIFLVVCGAVHAADTPSARIYEQYEALNTPENLAQRFIGGGPPPFVAKQIDLLNALMKERTYDAGSVVAKTVKVYRARVDALGAAKFRTSPLLALQVPLVSIMRQHVSSNVVYEELQAFAADPLMKEYARARALGAIALRRLNEFEKKGVADPDLKARAPLLLKTLVGEMPLKRLLHAPARLGELMGLVSAGRVTDPSTIYASFSAAATTDAMRYAADFVFVMTTGLKQVRAKQELTADEQAALVEAGRRWLDKWRPVVKTEPYSSDLVGEALLVMAGYPGNDALRVLLIDHDVVVRDTVPLEEEKPATPAPE